MVGVLSVTQTFAHLILWLKEISLYLSRKGMEWHNYVSRVSNLLELDVRNFLVVDVGWVVGWDESWKFWDVGLIL